MKGVKRTISSQHSTKLGKKHKISMCECSVISPSNCDVCAKIARKIHRLFGKRLALSNTEKYSKASAQPADASQEDVLVFADEVCDCGELDTDNCQICADFAIKMGVFVNIYSKSGLEEDVAEASKYPVDCQCAYLSNIGCRSCHTAITHIQSIFKKAVYATNGKDSTEMIPSLYHSNDVTSHMACTDDMPITTPVGPVCLATPTHIVEQTSRYRKSNITSSSTNGHNSTNTNGVTSIHSNGNSVKLSCNTESCTDSMSHSSTVSDSLGDCRQPTSDNLKVADREVVENLSDLSQYVAIDCEMVGVIDYKQMNAKGKPKMISVLARCSIVDAELNVLLDVFVKPDRPVADYRTKYSGITKSKLRGAISSDAAKAKIVSILKDKVVVGHTIRNDFEVIDYAPPAGMYRDIGQCRILRDMYKKKSRISGPGTCRVGLKKLSAVLLNSRIQEGSHCSVEDAVHTMKLYLLVRDQWETQLAHSPNSTSEDELSSTLYNNSSQYLDDFFWTSANQI